MVVFERLRWALILLKFLLVVVWSVDQLRIFLLLGVERVLDEL